MDERDVSEAPLQGAEALAQSAEHLAHVATQVLYAEQPELAAMGAEARARTLEDFGHHFRALATLDAGVFASHVDYCYGLFARRGFPRRWLDDGWRVMREVVGTELQGAVAEAALRILDGVSPPG